MQFPSPLPGEAAKHSYPCRRSASACTAAQNGSQPKESFVITSPLYYVNAGKTQNLHPGHLRCIMLALEHKGGQTTPQRPIIHRSGLLFIGCMSAERRKADFHS